MDKNIRKIFVVMLAAVLLFGIVPATPLTVPASAAQPALETQGVVYAFVYNIRQYRSTTVSHDATNGDAYDLDTVYDKFPIKEGYSFAGWYRDSRGQIPLEQSVTSGGAYAKFVPDSVTKTVAQVSKTVNYTTGSSAIRFISAVDSLDYAQAGVSLEKAGSDKVYVHATGKVYTNLSATGVNTGSSRFRPADVFGTDAAFMYALTLTGIKDQTGGYKATAYWITRDGTKVTHAVSSEKTVEMGVAANLAAGVTRHPTGDADVSWYDNSKDCFLLYDAADLRGFSVLSATRSFRGKTVKLAADIELNTGIAQEELIVKTGNTYTLGSGVEGWTPIASNSSMPFKGTFDGQGHTISGLATVGNGTRVGLFGSVEDAKICDLKLQRSYFRNQSASSFSCNTGAIAGFGSNVTVYNVSTDAHLSGGMMQGMVSYAGGLVDIRNCVFSGTLENPSSDYVYAGGIVGFGVAVDTKLYLTNCLFTGRAVGTFSASSYLGGIVGIGNYSNYLYITGCLSAGDLNPKEGTVISCSAGSIVGHPPSGGRGIFACNYATADCAENTIGDADISYTGEPVVVNRADLLADAAATAADLGIGTDWIAQSGQIPVPDMSQVGTSWYDSGKSVFTLYTPEDLYGFAALSRTHTFERQCVKLGADITLNTGVSSDWEFDAPANVWTPIGSADSKFAGIFDGQGHTISGLYMNQLDSDQHTALFAFVKNAEIRNLTLANTYFENMTAVANNAAIAADAEGIRLSDVKINRDVLLVNGGRIGIVASGTGDGTDTQIKLNRIWFDGTIRTRMYTNKVGSMVAFVNNVDNLKLIVEDCLYTGTCTVTYGGGDSIVGGLVGGVSGKVKTEMKNCVSAGTINVTAAGTLYVGSAIGLTSYNNGYSTITNVYAANETYRENGVSYAIDPIRTSNNYLGTFTLLPRADLTGTAATSAANGLNYESVWQTNVADVVTLQQTPSCRWYNPYQSVYTLETAEDLLSFAALSAYENFAGKTVNLAADITVNTGDASTWGQTAPENLWTPMFTTENGFAGTFDGCGHTISGLYVNQTGSAGLFRNISGGAVKNLTLENSYIAGGAMGVGAIAGEASGVTMENVRSDAFVVSTKTNESRTGGLAGCISGEAAATFRNCAYTGSLNVKGYYTGGLIGSIQTSGCVATIEECWFGGSLTSTTTTAGGLIGRVNTGATANLTRCAGTGSITSASTYRICEFIARCDGSASLSGCYGIEATASAAVGSGSYSGTTLLLNSTCKAAMDAYLRQGSTLDFTPFENYSDTNFSVSTPAQLLAFSAMSAGYDFAGKTVKLMADVELNRGDANLWGITAPACAWQPIGGNGVFSGTFDGRHHTISGLYCYLDRGNGLGLFRAVGGSGTAKDFHLCNSYLENGAQNELGFNGGVAAFLSGTATVSGIYTDAIVVAVDSYAGGLVGFTNGTKNTITQCQFAGALRARCALDGSCSGAPADNTAANNSRNHAVFVGGILGNAWGTSTAITDCYYSGRIYNGCSGYHRTGGIAGGTSAAGKTLEISRCISAGQFFAENAAMSAEYFSAVTDCRGSGTISNLAQLPAVNYALKSPLQTAQGQISQELAFAAGLGVTAATYTKEALVNEIQQGYLINKSILDFESVWTYRAGELPELKAFSDSTVSVVYMGAESDIPCLQLDDLEYATFNEVEWSFEEVGEDEDGTVYGNATETVVAENAPLFNDYYGNDVYLSKYQDATLNHYRTLIGEMQNAGYVKHSDSDLNQDCYTTSLTYGGNSYTVSYYVRTGDMYVTASKTMKLSPLLLESNFSTNAQTVSDAEVKLVMLPTVDTGDLYVLHLKNGHFAVFDGGSVKTLNNLLQYLEANVPAGQLPVIDAWFVTHGHYDHIGWTIGFTGTQSSLSGVITGGLPKNRVRVNGVYFNNPDEYITANTTYAWRSDGYRTETGNPWPPRVAKAAAAMKTENGTATPLYRPQAGQRYYLSGVTVEVPYTQEQITFDEYQMDLNASSTWYLVQANGRQFLEAGDTENVNMAHVVQMYSTDYGVYKEQLDIMSVFHHGHNAYEQFKDTFRAPILFYTKANMSGWASQYAAVNRYFTQTLKLEYYYYGQGQATYHFATGKVTVP